jgi:hypothetical protein
MTESLSHISGSGEVEDHGGSLPEPSNDLCLHLQMYGGTNVFRQQINLMHF